MAWGQASVKMRALMRLCVTQATGQTGEGRPETTDKLEANVERRASEAKQPSWRR